MNHHLVLTIHARRRLAQRGISLRSLEYVRLQGRWLPQHRRRRQPSDSYLVALHRDEIPEEDLPGWSKCANIVAIINEFNQLITVYRTHLRTRQPYCRPRVHWRCYLNEAG